MPDLHVVYGTRAQDGARVRLSAPMGWHAAIDRWQHLTPRAGVQCAGRMPLAYLSVRSADDPAWPARAQRERPRDPATGRFV